MANRRNLDSAHKGKKDEFYTQYEDVEREVNAYLDYDRDTFKDKTVLCPCDDPEWSSFTRYFAQNFKKLGLKKLITTSFANDSKFEDIRVEPSDYEKSSPNYDPNKTFTHGKVFVLERKPDGSCDVDMNDLKWTYLEGDGDFRSSEGKKLRDEADIIVTNPPFSLFREFVAWLMEANKKFLILGDRNAISYKEIYPLLIGGKMWIGCRFNERVNGKNLTYRVPDFYEMNACELYQDNNGDKYITVPGTGWFTNLDHGRRHQPLSLMSMEDNIKYSKHPAIKGQPYRKYDNCDAIDIPFVDSIPSDYDGLMGVPVTFFGKYCPEQFELVRFRKGDDGKDLCIDGKPTYFRVLIRRK